MSTAFEQTVPGLSPGFGSNIADIISDKLDEQDCEMAYGIHNENEVMINTRDMYA